MQSKEQDFEIYKFNNQLVHIINQSSLSYGEIVLILSDLLQTMQNQYQINVEQYLNDLNGQE